MTAVEHWCGELLYDITNVAVTMAICDVKWCLVVYSNNTIRLLCVLSQAQKTVNPQEETVCDV